MASRTVARHASLGIFHVPSPTAGIFAPLRSDSASTIPIPRSDVSVREFGQKTCYASQHLTRVAFEP